MVTCLSGVILHQFFPRSCELNRALCANIKAGGLVPKDKLIKYIKDKAPHEFLIIPRLG